jgi:hypothetical protein
MDAWTRIHRGFVWLVSRSATVSAWYVWLRGPRYRRAFVEAALKVLDEREAAAI